MAITVSALPVQMVWTGIIGTGIVVLIGWIFPLLINQDSLFEVARIHFVIGILTVVATFLIRAPYGKHSKELGPLVPVFSARWGWILQESPTLLAFAYSVFKQIEASRVGMRIELEYEDSWIDDITGWIHPALSVLSSPGRLYVMHYIHRTLIFPFKFNSGNGTPLYIVMMAALYTSFNSCIQVQATQTVKGVMRPQSLMDLNDVQYPIGLVGVALFCFGMYVNVSADYALIALRGDQQPANAAKKNSAIPSGLAKKAAADSGNKLTTTAAPLGDKRYKIPTGFWMYNYISCPNYFGEFLEWTGYALVATAFAFTDFDKEAMEFSDYLVTPWLALLGLAEPNKVTAPCLAAFSFAFYTAANTFPRGIANHQWYLDTFGDEYKKLNRKAVIPFLL